MDENKIPLISHIQRFSLDDGPGIRTTVFLKGCNLRCDWCHNPECIAAGKSLQFLARSCTGCGTCVRVCRNGVHHIDDTGKHTIERKKCTACGECEYHCPASAITIIGGTYTPEELLTELLKDKAFFETSGGGVTFSGGEPLLHADFLCTVAKAAKREGLHIGVDTAGNVPYQNFELILPYVDLFLYDIKFFNPEKHRRAAGADNTRIKDNVQRLSYAVSDKASEDHGGQAPTKERTKIIIRTAVIKGYNNDLEEIKDMADFLSGLPSLEHIELLPFHTYGIGKYETLGLESRVKETAPLAPEFMEKALSIYREKGLTARIV